MARNFKYMAHIPHTPLSQDRVTWPRLIAYGSGGIIPIALFNISGQLMGLIGNISLGLSAFWLGVIMIFPRLWDAISDPVMGHLSDNTRTRWGRRRPYILIGGLLVAISFAGIWWIPEELGELGQLAFILGGLLIFFSACTMFEIPHGALGMEMSKDPHERTRLFSAKSFFGNLFAMGTPWLLFFAGLKVVRGTGGTLIDGMRITSLIIAVIMIPLVIWWFFGTSEPGYANARKQQRPKFWPNMKATIRNRTFVCLILIIFTLAMGFNFVGLFNYYISIYYLFGGDQYAAGALLGINGTVWAVTGLIAVFPLNWISPRIGKRKTLLLAIGLMCAAQLSKIVCYNPEIPYLVIIPTILLSMGMLMFFTLGASMVGDICDEDELNTGTRSEGSYYSVYWWFIKMGTAFASLVTGALLVATQFNETQSKQTGELFGSYEVIVEDAQEWATEGELEIAETTKEHIELWISQYFEDKKDLALRTTNTERLDRLLKQLDETLKIAAKLATSFESTVLANPTDAAHTRGLSQRLIDITQRTQILHAQAADWVLKPDLLHAEIEEILHESTALSAQAPRPLLWLRIIEIGLPLVLSIISVLLTLRYPLTEDRCYEIKALLDARKLKESNA
jgi:glycoside/pentoside/hexuronide:cation symporter, GPH family